MHGIRAAINFPTLTAMTIWGVFLCFRLWGGIRAGYGWRAAAAVGSSLLNLLLDFHGVAWGNALFFELFVHLLKFIVIVVQQYFQTAEARPPHDCRVG